MSSWSEIAAQEPEFAGRVERLFGAGRHKTIATLRAGGAPRISGIECEFADGELRFASMPDSRKLADLRRDLRFALHGPTVDPVAGNEAAWPGEAKVSGLARRDTSIEADEGRPEGEAFVADVREIVVTHLNEDATKLVVEWWTPSGGHQVVERD